MSAVLLECPAPYQRLLEGLAAMGRAMPATWAPAGVFEAFGASAQLDNNCKHSKATPKNRDWWSTKRETTNKIKRESGKEQGGPKEQKQGGEGAAELLP